MEKNINEVDLFFWFSDWCSNGVTLSDDTPIEIVQENAWRIDGEVCEEFKNE